MMETWLVTGYTGFVGRRVVRYWEKDLDKRVIGLTRQELDFTDAAQIERVFDVLKPSLLIHAGAISSTGLCQKDPSLSFEVNVMGTKRLAQACSQRKVKMIFLSSDQVYGGEKGQEPHREEESLTPANVYGKHKLAAEELVDALLPDGVSLRLTWMYDLPGKELGVKQNFLTLLLNSLKEGIPAKFSDRDKRGVTYVDEVVKNIGLCGRLPKGVYNFGSSSDKSMYEIAVMAARLLGKENQVSRDEETHLESRNLLMDPGKARKAGIVFSDPVEGIRKCLQDYGYLPR